MTEKEDDHQVSGQARIINHFLLKQVKFNILKKKVGQEQKVKSNDTFVMTRFLGHPEILTELPALPNQLHVGRLIPPNP